VTPLPTTDIKQQRREGERIRRALIRQLPTVNQHRSATDYFSLSALAVRRLICRILQNHCRAALLIQDVGFPLPKPSTESCSLPCVTHA